MKFTTSPSLFDGTSVTLCLLAVSCCMPSRVDAWQIRPHRPTVPVVVTDTNHDELPSRRRFLHTTSAVLLAWTTTTAINTQPATAVAPLSFPEAEAGLGLSRWKRPKPPSKDVSRQQLNLDFAVLLTRASHMETNQLDIGSAQQLERDMYLVRTTELDPYRQSLPASVTMSQGDLTDPYYFDYFSFVQYETINRAVQDPETEYEEREPVFTDDDTDASPKFTTHQVRRTLADDQLVSTHDARVGKDVLDYLRDRNDGTPVAIPTFEGHPDHAQFQQSLKQLVNLFVMSGFAWDGSVEMTRQGDAQTTFALTLDNPATLWSAQCLAKQKAPLRNDYLLKTARQLAHSMNFDVVSTAVKLQGDRERSFLTIA